MFCVRGTLGILLSKFGDSLKAQNARGAGGGCFIGGPRNLATAVVKGMCLVRPILKSGFTADKSIFSYVYQ